MSGKIFINYRQRDANGKRLPHVLLVEALADRLAIHFGRDAVYLDTTLRPGEPYPRALRSRVVDAAVVLVVIHSDWLADLEARTDRRRDWVREEIATAIEVDIKLLPVILEGGERPKHEDLPPAVRALADNQVVVLRFGSLADGIAATIAEIEMTVAPDVPGRVTPVAPLPDRSRLAPALLLFLAFGLLSGYAAVTDAMPFPGLPPALSFAVLTGGVLLYLVAILLLAACGYAFRRLSARFDERLARTPNRAFVVFGGGVLVVAMCQQALLAVSGLGLNSAVAIVVASVSILVAMAVCWLRNQERTLDWPHAPANPTPFWVRKALVDLEDRLGTWPAPLPLRHQREALVALSSIRGALATISDASSQRLLTWWRARSPWLTLPHSALASAALTLATTALALQWSAEGPDLVSTSLWFGATLLAVGAYWGSLTFEHSRERWQIRAVAEAALERLAALEDRLSDLSQPGLIAIHHTKGRFG